MSTSRLIIFARFPEPGSTKTRLIPALGADGAAALHQKMTLHTLTAVDNYAKAHTVSVEIWFTGGTAEQMSHLYGDHRTYVPQPNGNLGTRMEAASNAAFGQGKSAVVLIGTDCPELSTATIHAAFLGLNTADVVLGPATDGGYYLIGLGEPSTLIFQSIDWGTELVLQQTIQQANKASRTIVHLHELSDVDEPEDVAVWDRCRTQDQTISIIIPALNEEEAIGPVIDVAKEGTNLEVIVIDGGSVDLTREVAQTHGAVVVSSKLGRGTQMNAGASVASGSILLFLHADTLLPQNYDQHVRGILGNKKVVAGAFRLTSDSPSARMRLILLGANLRSTFLNMPYGDQAIFLRNSTFQQLGGFQTMPIMEDFELLQRLRKLGQITIAPASVKTSARRWHQHGILRTSAKNLCCASAYLAGVSPERIASWRGQRQ